MKFIFLALFAILPSQLAQAKVANSILLNAVTNTTAGSSVSTEFAQRTFQLTCATTAGAGAAVGIVQVSNDDVNWMTLGTITHGTTGTTAVTDGFATNAAWRYVRGKLSSISGTGGNCTMIMTAEVHP